MSALKGDTAAIWPDKLHAKGLAAGCRGRVLPAPATELSPSAIYHAATCLAYLALYHRQQQEKPLLQANQWPMVLFLTSQQN